MTDPSARKTAFLAALGSKGYRAMSIAFGEFLVLRKKVSSKSVLQIMKRRLRSRPQLGELAVHNGWMTWGQVLGIIGVMERRDDMRFGDVAVEMGMLTGEQVQDLLAEQAACTPTLEQCLVDMDILTVDEITSERSAYEHSKPPMSEIIA